ncbi:zinc finger BED domain-containing protein RICESLEEPER 4-like [Argentina anserina]|uniref:zinc finger BED domain-containing protein RICESLEEPER 4-like n=1 Tax=Argentina anserina TaxID=57926 RepID=UPI0021768421|nr:zinc finger BED domain-containing protein RICESLEEPER 4-like [Potentilla anserina]
MARGKKSGLVRPNPSASGLGSSSTAASPTPLELLEVGSQPASSQTPAVANGPAPSVVEPAASVSEGGESSSLGTKRTSMVWDHFKEYEKFERVKDVHGKVIQRVQRRAYCIHCPRGKFGDFIVEGKSGTSGLLRHLNQGCRYFPHEGDKTQKNLVGDKSRSNKLSTSTKAQNQEDFVEACVEMIVIDELPFSFVDKLGFNIFCQRVCPSFEKTSRRTVCRRFLNMYGIQKHALKKSLKAYRLSLTTDTWTSVQNINYMVLTAHFVDADWKMHKRILNFSMIQNHQGPTIGKLIESCLVQWGIEKVMCVTVDNASSNKCALEWLVAKMNKSAAYDQILNGKYMHVRCTAHITNLIVGHGLKRLQKSVLAIRNAVKFVRSSANRLDIFKKAVEREKLECKGLVCMDVPTRWNSTYIMLESALKFEQVFALMLEDEESTFAAYFKEPDEEFDEDGNLVPSTSHRKKVGPPNEEDWDKAKVFVNFLRLFYEVTLRNSASLHPTVHTALHDVIDMETNIKSLLLTPRLASGLETTKTLIDMASNMRSKWLKYFGSFGDLNNMLVIGLVLDARFKLKNVTHMYMEEELPVCEVERRTKEIKKLFMDLYNQYVVHVDEGIHMLRPHSPNSSSSTIISGSSSSSGHRGQRLSNWKKLVQEKEEAVAAHEVDQYLDAALDPTDEEDHFDILSWWKINSCRYPVLAAIARDVLVIQTSTVASESCFSIGGRVIDCFRSSLTPKTVEGLICMQNWMLGDDIAKVEVEADIPTMINTEFYEGLELDHEDNASSKNNCPSPTPRGKGKGKGKFVPVENVINV